MLTLTATMVFAGAAAGFFHLRTGRKELLTACAAISAFAMVSQLLWLVQMGKALERCVLLEPWGIVGIIVLTAIGTSALASHHYGSARLLVGGLAILFVTLLIAAATMKTPAASDKQMNWPLALHIVLEVVGFCALAVGCVAGLLFLVRSKALKAKGMPAPTGIPWPALTSLDRVFAHGTGLGVLFLAGGMFVGIVSVYQAAMDHPWYADGRVILTFLACILYGVVWVLRKRQGFCSRRLVGLGTLGFTVVLLGFFAPDLFTEGFHLF